MKKLLMLSLVALFTVSVARAEKSRADMVTRVESCEAILQDFERRPETAIPANVLQRAKALIILNQFKAGFLFGVKDGYGVIMVRRPDNSWSIPVLIRAGEASLGLQVGANELETILVITDPAIPKLLFNHRFNVGVDAKAIAGPHEASKERYKEEILKTPILAYTKALGLYVGATVKAGHISRDDAANFVLYNTRYTMPELLYGDFVPPVREVEPLMHLVQRIAP
jgi:lipid-binding SYLF domain-containing protein